MTPATFLELGAVAYLVASGILGVAGEADGALIALGLGTSLAILGIGLEAFGAMEGE